MSDKPRASNTPRTRLDQSQVRRSTDQKRWSVAEEALVPSGPLLHSGRNVAARDYLGVAVLATSCVVIVPALAAVALLIGLLDAPLPLAAGIAAVSPALVIVLGKRVWRNDRRSEVLELHELMLWSWINHWHVERRIRRSSSALQIGKWTPQQRLKILHDLNSALEHKDPDTLGHSRRVKRYCYRMAEAMALPSNTLDVLVRAAELHDVGKVVIPDRILRKPERLNPRERLIIQAHAEAGAELVEGLGDTTVTSAVRHHHERWDGQGYPEGLSGTRIPLLARIIAVADTFDAITSSRSYRERRSRADAVQVLVEESGRQFDPHAVQSFLSTMASTSSLLLVLPFVSVPRRYLERALLWIKEAGVETVAPAVAASGAAIIVTASLVGGNVSEVQSQRKPPTSSSHQQHVSTTTAMGLPHDLDPRFTPEPLVLGRRIRIQPRPSKQASFKKERQTAAGPAETTSGEPASSSRSTRSVRDNRRPESRNVGVPEDPQSSRGKDCTVPPASRGQKLHCGT